MKIILLLSLSLNFIACSAMAQKKDAADFNSQPHREISALSNDEISRMSNRRILAKLKEYGITGIKPETMTYETTEHSGLAIFGGETYERTVDTRPTGGLYSHFLKELLQRLQHSSIKQPLSFPEGTVVTIENGDSIDTSDFTYLFLFENSSHRNIDIPATEEGVEDFVKFLHRFPYQGSDEALKEEAVALLIKEKKSWLRRAKGITTKNDASSKKTPGERNEVYLKAILYVIERVQEGEIFRSDLSLGGYELFQLDSLVHIPFWAILTRRRVNLQFRSLVREKMNSLRKARGLSESKSKNVFRYDDSPLSGHL